MTTFERLEVLLFLHKHSGEEHTAQSVADRTGITRELVHEALAGLASCGIAARGKVGETFSFAPANVALAEAVAGLAKAYREQSAAVLSAMSVYAIERIRSGPLRAFADSFIFGKGKGNG